MDKIDKIEVVRLSLIFFFLLILGITIILFFSGVGKGDFNVMTHMFDYIVVVILMGTFAVIVKYVGDILKIVLKPEDR